jgi:hypothetical protein
VELAQVAERFDNAVSTIAQGIGEGLFPANPGAEYRGAFSNCTWCDFNTLCPTRRDVRWERKQVDPRLQGYLQLQAGESALEDREE